MRYFPESAYWASADVDIPVFLPSYIYARWLDIHQLAAETRARSLPNIEGHVLFTSGHEWGYWMTDYLTAKMALAPERELDDLLGDYGAIYGSCADTARATLRKFIDLQNTYLYDQRLSGYVSGEDLHDDLGAIAGFTTHPVRLPFEALLEKSAEERGAFEREVIAELEEFAAQIEPILEDTRAMCRGASADVAPFCRELEDGVEIVGLRVTHSAELYRAVLEALEANGEQSRAYYDRALATAEKAKAVVARRERSYRFDAPRLVDGYENPTIYKFGYLRQAHTLCFWRRPQEQALQVIEKRSAKSVLELPTCLEDR
jgi:hypothetical protein